MNKAKRILLLLCLLLPIAASSMKIVTDEIDEFMGTRTIITSWERADKGYIHIRFRLQNGVQWLDYKYLTHSPVVVGEGALLMFKSTSDSIASFKSASVYSSDFSRSVPGLPNSSYWELMATYTGDISWFANNVVKLIRLYERETYTDKKISEDGGKRICKLYNLFANALGSEPGKAAAYNNYTITYLESKNSGRSWDIVREEFVRDLTPDELTAKMNEWKLKSSGNHLFNCKAKKEK